MGIDKQLERQGVEITPDNTQPVGSRTQRNFKRVISAMRAAESEFNDALHEANAKCAESQETVIKLQKHCRELENELQKFKVTAKLDTFETLTVADRQAVLTEVSDKPLATEPEAVAG